MSATHVLISDGVPSHALARLFSLLVPMPRRALIYPADLHCIDLQRSASVSKEKFIPNGAIPPPGETITITGRILGVISLNGGISYFKYRISSLSRNSNDGTIYCALGAKSMIVTTNNPDIAI